MSLGAHIRPMPLPVDYHQVTVAQALVSGKEIRNYFIRSRDRAYQFPLSRKQLQIASITTTYKCGTICKTQRLPGMRLFLARDLRGPEDFCVRISFEYRIIRSDQKVSSGRFTQQPNIVEARECDALQL